MLKDKFELPNGSYSVSDIQVYFDDILKNIILNNNPSDNPLIRIYVNKIENRIIIRTKTGYYVELLMPEIMKLRGSTKSKKTGKKAEIGDNLPHLENAEVVLFSCDIANSDYQHNSRVLYTFVSNKFFGQLLDISPKSFSVFKNL